MKFITYEVAKKLKEKGFTCQYPIAMYNELGSFHALYTSADHNQNIKSVFGDREYYDYDDFDDKDCICPTISQALDWLRTNHGIHVRADLWRKGWYFDVISYEYDESLNEYKVINKYQSKDYKSYDDAMLVGIEYVIYNLI